MRMWTRAATGSATVASLAAAKSIVSGPPPRSIDGLYRAASGVAAMFCGAEVGEAASAVRGAVEGVVAHVAEVVTDERGRLRRGGLDGGAQRGRRLAEGRPHEDARVWVEVPHAREATARDDRVLVQRRRGAERDGAARPVEDGDAGVARVDERREVAAQVGVVV